MTALATKTEYEGGLVRGRPSRTPNLKELFQAGVVSSIAAAAGCVAKCETIDTGIDVTVTYETCGARDRTTINLQLKCTEKGDVTSEYVTVKVPKSRYDEYRYEGKNEPLILVAQLIHPEIDHWIDHGGAVTYLGARNYWLNLTGLEKSDVADNGDVTVRVPTKNVFDDAALIELFTQHIKGSV